MTEIARGIILAGTIREATDRDLTIRLASEAETAKLLGANASIEIESGLLYQGPDEIPSAEPVYVRRGSSFREIGRIHQVSVVMQSFDVSTFGSETAQAVGGLRRLNMTVVGYVGADGKYAGGGH